MKKNIDGYSSKRIDIVGPERLLYRLQWNEFSVNASRVSSNFGTASCNKLAFPSNLGTASCNKLAFPKLS